MKIEKINEDKIKIIFNDQDLKENHISLHSFMSNSIENQQLFLNLLEVAEKEVGFQTDNYKVCIETLALKNGNFILIVTRLHNSIFNTKSRLHFSRKFPSIQNQISVYQFHQFDIFCEFCHWIYMTFPESISIFKDKASLYKYHKQYYLLIDQILLPKEVLFKITTYFTEFAEFTNLSAVSIQKLKEYGNIIISKNAISIGNTYFNKI